MMLLPGDPRPVQKFIENQRIIRRITAKKVTQLTVPLSKETLICIMPEDIQGELLKDNTRE
ncbi:MAG: hypothetical protein JXQ27_07775 [Acidobacteria bacterium]|nr:hypothetical protein [Acidobacteriota bacterium]